MQDPKEYEFNTEFMKSEEFLKSSFYLDMRCFKDIYLGILMRHIKSQEEYDIFLDFVSSAIYKNRIIDNKEIWFDKDFIDVSHKEIINIINRSSDHDRIFLESPNTDSLVFIKDSISKAFQCHNIFDNKECDMKLSFNTYPLKLSKKIQKILRIMLEKYFHIDCNVLYKTPEDLIKDLYDFDCLFIYNLDEFMKLNPFDNLKTEDIIRRLSELHVFTYRLIHDEKIIEKISKEEIEKDFIFCEQFLNIFFNFSFLKPSSVLVEKGE